MAKVKLYFVITFVPIIVKTSITVKFRIETGRGYFDSVIHRKLTSDTSVIVDQNESIN